MSPGIYGWKLGLQCSCAEGVLLQGDWVTSALPSRLDVSIYGLVSYHGSDFLIKVSSLACLLLNHVIPSTML